MNFLESKGGVLVGGSKAHSLACPYWHRPACRKRGRVKNSDLFRLPRRRQLVLGCSRVKISWLACPILSASPAPRLSRGANERKARQSAGRINPGRVRRRETGAALMPGLSRRAPPTGHGEYEEVPPLAKPSGQLTAIQIYRNGDPKEVSTD